MSTKNRFIGYLAIIVVSLLVVEAISCSGRSDGNRGSVPVEVPVPDDDERQKIISVISPSNYDKFVFGDVIDVSVSLERPNRRPDSVVVTIDGNKFGLLLAEPWDIAINSTELVTLGRKTLKASAYSEGKLKTSVSRVIYLYSDVEPKHYGYEVVNVYPHDSKAFTQGLFFDSGKLYEGTGQEGSSSLREVDLLTGNVERQLNLEPNLFGEGITMYNNLIYQVTWTSNVGFVYLKDDFKLVRKIYYQSEGWGLTTVGDKIVISYGTSTLWFYDPEVFSVVSKVEVCDDKGAVEQLNELEYINGEIWANIWMTNRIARIDPKSGRVTGYIDLSGLLDDTRTDADLDVLNGIAYDNENGRIFVTGKNWPKLFEIRVKAR